MHKMVGDKVEKGDLLATIYSETESRLKEGVENCDIEKTWEIA